MYASLREGEKMLTRRRATKNHDALKNAGLLRGSMKKCTNTRLLHKYTAPVCSNMHKYTAPARMHEKYIRLCAAAYADCPQQHEKISRLMRGSIENARLVRVRVPELYRFGR